MENSRTNLTSSVPRSFRAAITALNWLDPLVPDIRQEFKVEKLMDAACTNTGLTDYGDLAFIDPLSIFLHSINDDVRVRRLVRLLERMRIVTILGQRLQMQAAFNCHPEILNTPIHRPIIIASLPRTGSTLLQRLLANDPNVRSLFGWEALAPINIGVDARNGVDPRITRARRLGKIVRWITSIVRSIHEFDPEQPEECGPLLRSTFLSPFYWLVLEEYGDWYLRQSQERLAQAYLEYRQSLQFVQSERPVPNGGHWVLKSPFHSFAIPAIQQVFPDATVVLLHRDPTRVVTSFASWNEYFYDVFLIRRHAENPYRWSRRSIAWCEEAMRRAELARTKDQQGRIYDMNYHDLVNDPVGTIRSFYNRTGYQFTQEFERGIGTWLSANPQGKHGRHRYYPEQYGYTQSELAERFRWYTQSHMLKLEENHYIAEKIPAVVSDLQAYVFRNLITTGIGTVAISFSGQIDPSRLRRALRLMFDAEPILGCHFVGGRRQYWQRRDDLSTCSSVEMWLGPEIDHKIYGFLTGTIDPTTDPLLKVAIARRETDVLYLQVSHTVCDGPSLGHIVARFASIYKELGVDPNTRIAVSDNCLRDIRAVTKLFSTRKKLAIVRGLIRKMSLPRFSWKLPDCPSYPPFCGYLTMKIPPERVRILQRYGRNHRATLTAVMIAGFYLAARQILDLTGDKFAIIGTTTDLRRFLPRGAQETAPSNFVGTIPCRIDSLAGSDFVQVLLSVRDQLKEGLRDPTQSASVPSVVLSFPGIHTIFRRLPFDWIQDRISRLTKNRLKQPGRQLAIVNLGDYDPAVVDFGGPVVKDVVVHGPLFFGLGIGMVFSTFCDRLTLTVGFTGDVAPETVIRRLLQALDANLPGSGGTPLSIDTWSQPN